MDLIRKSLGALFAALGVYYCALGSFTLLRLPTVTTQWIQQSGDPDFHYDYSLFMMLTALGAAFVALLGWRTVVQGVATARGRRASWLGLAISAVPLHWFWFLHRTIAAGLLDHQGHITAQRNAAIQFGSVCTGYLLLWLLMRRRRGEFRRRSMGVKLQRPMRPDDGRHGLASG
jgi:uncharacterized membrane protein